MDIFFMEKNGALNTYNFTWMQFNKNNAITSNFTQDIGNTTSGINCRYDSVENDLNYYCVFTTNEKCNQTTFFRAKINTDGTANIDTLKVGTESNDITGCLSIPSLRDLDYNNNLEAVYCNSIIGSTNKADLIMIDVSNLQLKNSFSGDGIITDAYEEAGTPISPMLVNMDGSEDANFEIVIGYSTTNGIIRIFNNFGVQRLKKQFTDEPELSSFSRTDVNGDGKYDIVVWLGDAGTSATMTIEAITIGVIGGGKDLLKNSIKFFL